MLQRSKEIREAAAAAAAAAAATSAEGQEKTGPSDGDSANTSTTNTGAAGAADGPASSRPAALREQIPQASTTQHSSASRTDVASRKNRDLKEEPRLSDTRGPRQLKENRERQRDMRDVRDSRDQRDRFSRDRPFPPRDRRRDNYNRDQEPREPKMNASK